jgi:hypothetical protein
MKCFRLYDSKEKKLILAQDREGASGDGLLAGGS